MNSQKIVIVVEIIIHKRSIFVHIIPSYTRNGQSAVISCKLPWNSTFRAIFKIYYYRFIKAEIFFKDMLFWNSFSWFATDISKQLCQMRTSFVYSHYACHSLAYAKSWQTAEVRIFVTSPRDSQIHQYFISSKSLGICESSGSWMWCPELQQSMQNW